MLKGEAKMEDDNEPINNLHLIEKVNKDKALSGWSRSKKNDTTNKGHSMDLDMYGVYKGKEVKIYASVRTAKGLMVLAKYDDGEYANNKKLIHIKDLESLHVCKKKILSLKINEGEDNGGKETKKRNSKTKKSSKK